MTDGWVGGYVDDVIAENRISTQDILGMDLGYVR